MDARWYRRARMYRPSGRLVSVLGLYLVLGLAGAWYLAGSTQPGADLATYHRAADDLWLRGDPYASVSEVPEDYRYRYPPLLAMLTPVLGWPPLWFLIIAVSTAVPIWLAVRHHGWLALLPALMLLGAWGQQLLNGNAQAIVVALLAFVPHHRRLGAVGLAVATMLKLHPALAVIWYVGRRDWTAVGWFAAATAVLLLVQLPWLDDFVRFYLTEPVATSTIPGMSLRAWGVPVWAIAVVVVGFLAYRGASGRWGWFLATVWQLVALPRVLLVNLALLLAAPLPGKDRAATEKG